MRVLGIDEAGRGCVLGALFVGGFVVEVEDESIRRAAGADDSKALSPKKRLEVRERLKDLGRSDVRAVPAAAIAESSMNALEEAVIVDLVKTWRPRLVRCDALGPPAGIPKLIARLEAALPKKVRPKWVIEPKADSTFAVVGAASVFAKTTRDAALADLASSWGELGSGYPSDPATRTWLREHAKSRRPWPEFVRTRWSTISDLAQESFTFGVAPPAR
jgi:ribonuclease HII